MPAIYNEGPFQAIIEFKFKGEDWFIWLYATNSIPETTTPPVLIAGTVGGVGVSATTTLEDFYQIFDELVATKTGIEPDKEGFVSFDFTFTANGAPFPVNDGVEYAYGVAADFIIGRNYKKGEQQTGDFHMIDSDGGFIIWPSGNPDDIPPDAVASFRITGKFKYNSGEIKRD